jgi:hypothetical protein
MKRRTWLVPRAIHEAGFAAAGGAAHVVVVGAPRELLAYAIGRVHELLSLMTQDRVARSVVDDLMTKGAAGAYVNVGGHSFSAGRRR